MTKSRCIMHVNTRQVQTESRHRYSWADMNNMLEIRILDQGETIADRWTAQIQRSPYNGQAGGAVDQPTPAPSMKCTATDGPTERAPPYGVAWQLSRWPGPFRVNRGMKPS